MGPPTWSGGSGKASWRSKPKEEVAKGASGGGKKRRRGSEVRKRPAVPGERDRRERAHERGPVRGLSSYY